MTKHLHAQFPFFLVVYLELLVQFLLNPVSHVN